MNRLIDKVFIGSLSGIAMLTMLHGNFLVAIICIMVAIGGINFYLFGDLVEGTFPKYESIFSYIGITLDIIILVAILINVNMVFLLPVVIYDVVLSMNYAGFFLAALAYVNAVMKYVKSGDKKVIIFVSIIMLLSIYLSINSTRVIKLLRKNISLRDDTHIKEEQLSKKNAQLIVARDEQIYAAQLAERNRIAREIHDNVGHMLSRAILQMGALLSIYKDEPIHGQLEGVRETLDGAMNNIRSSVHDLHDESIDVKAQIISMAKPLEEKYKVNLDIDINEDMERQIKYVIIGVVKEAISNIMKYSLNTNVDIKLIWHPSMYQLIIHDYNSVSENDKKGMMAVSADNSKYIQAGTGMGLEGIRNRVESVGGIVNIMDNDGFKIFITIPINN